jgi:hypothetical protein
MPQSWITALNAYEYPVRLPEYRRSGEFPGFFTRDIVGDRASTMEFEDYFRANSDKQIEPYFEVVFWKLYSQPMVRQGTTSRIVDHVKEQGVEASELRCAVDLFVQKPTKANLSVLRALLGIKTDVLALALTFSAFFDPRSYPMMDTKTARWVKEHHSHLSANRRNRLTPFKLNYSSLRYNDFDNYLNWVDWCRESDEILTTRTGMRWRARDVEMAVFAAAREGLSLNPL